MRRIFPRFPFWVLCAFLTILSWGVLGLAAGYNYYLEQPAILNVAYAIGYVAPFGVLAGFVWKL